MTIRAPTKSPAFDSPAAAVTAMIAQLEPVAKEPVELSRAPGRVLAQAIQADRPSPACDVSAMDGYAVRLADLSAATLQISDEVAIGHAPPAMPTGAALRIFTGGAVPTGADAVIPREQVTERTDSIEIHPGLTVNPGQHIRRRGENVQAGQTVVEPGLIVSPAVSAALATFGVTRPAVHRRIEMAAIVTGNEVLAPEESVEPWQLRDSNGPTLAGMFGVVAWIDFLGARHVTDDPDQLRQAAADALQRVDALILSGGVSAGDYDFVPKVLTELGCRTVFHRLPVRPGRPTLGAIGPAGQAIFGLPGNPVSVMSTARRIAMPVFRHLAGCAQPEPPTACVELTDADEKTLPLYWWRPVRLIGNGRAELVATQGSGDLVSTARSDGFVELPPNQRGPGPWPFYRWSLADA